jgi:hypothetical protein
MADTLSLVRPAPPAIDWSRVADELDAQGFAVVGPLLGREDCRALARLYDEGDGFRSRVIMQRHAFGRGEYKYFPIRCRRRSRRSDMRSTRSSCRSPIAGARR